ncbi:MAG: type 4b pilus protein PilO2 [Alphaproteobacteria bacterium]
MQRIIPQVITVKNKKYAVGLFWQPLASGKQKLGFIEKTARSLIGGAQFFCIRSGGSSQFGLGFSKKGHKKNLPIATLSIASALKDKASVLAVFKVKEGWWLVVIRNNLILPEDDFLFEKEEEAQKSFNELLNLPDWGYKIAPASWQITGTKDVSLSNLLQKSRPVLLKSIAKKSIFQILFILLFLGIGGYFLKGIIFPKVPVMQKSFHKKKFSPEKIKKKTKKKKSILKTIKQEIKSKKQISSWENLLDLKEHASFCQSGLKYFGYPIPGWEMTEINCDNLEIKSKYQRRGGSLDFFKTAYRTYFNTAKIEIVNSGNSILLSMKLPKISKKTTKPFLKKEEIENRLISFSQKTDQKIVITKERSVAKTPQKFSIVNFSFSSKIPVRDWSVILSTFGAVEWKSMQWRVQNKTWNAKGVIYATN